MSDIRNTYANFGRYSADLCLFLLVARHGQLSGAAAEAGLSQPRLSQRMRFLEDSLDRKLFVRVRRGVRLSAAGRQLLDALEDPVTAAASAFDRYRQTGERRRVVIASDIAIANFMLLPDFASLSAVFGDLSISLLTSQMPEINGAANADLIIRMEPLHPAGPQEVCLFRERVSAICSPAYKAAHEPMRGPGDLADKTLIDLSYDDPKVWFTWDDWLKQVGTTRMAGRESIAFSSYDHVIRAATSGLGIALGWEGLIDIDGEGSPLVRAIPDRLESARGYYLRIAAGRASPETTAVFDWLAERFTRDAP